MVIQHSAVLGRASGVESNLICLPRKLPDPWGQRHPNSPSYSFAAPWGGSFEGFRRGRLGIRRGEGAALIRVPASAGNLTYPRAVEPIAAVEDPEIP